MNQLDVKHLGILDYQSALNIQLELLRKRIDDEIKDTVLFVEHSPVITIGRNGDKSNLLISEKILKDRGVDYFEVTRGGDITYHGPGQLVCYPIINLSNHFKDVHRYLRTLEQIIIELLVEFNIDARRFEGLTGVFVKRSKIASIGVGIKRWVTFHGLSLNVNTDLSYFDMIVPCGLNNNPVTSIKTWNKLDEDINIKEVEDLLVKGFTKHFDYE